MHSTILAKNSVCLSVTRWYCIETMQASSLIFAKTRKPWVYRKAKAFNERTLIMHCITIHVSYEDATKDICDDYNFVTCV